MASHFDQILDECLDRILVYGEAVEQCLARYPQWAGELGPQLTMSARLHRVHAFAPTAEALATGRQRLHAELLELEHRDQSRAARHSFSPWWSVGWPLRWAATAVVLLIAVVLGGGVVAASGNALPGDALYPVKRVAEEVRLAFALSGPGKADLHLAYAERRSQEISALVEQGRLGRLESAGQSLGQHVTEAARITGELQDSNAAARLRDRLQESASRSLASLQLALQGVPGPDQEAASEVFTASSATFGTAIETVAARHPEPRAAATGSVQFWAADPPSPVAEQVLVQVERIEIYLAAGDDSQWETVTRGPQTFDLLRVAEVQKFLGEQEVPHGSYSRVRFHITGAAAVVSGEERPVQVPADAITLVRPFRVEADKTTMIVLDFDGRRSFQDAGQGRFTVTPVVRVLAQEPGAGVMDRRDGPDLTERLLPRPEISGTIEAVSEDYITVAGQNIRIGSSTRVEDTPQQGRRVKVEVALQPDGTFLATRVQLDQEARPSTPTPSRPDKEGPEGPEPARVEISGVIQSMQSDEWLVSGQRVRLGPGTSIDGAASAGVAVQVHGIRQEDGAIAAIRISVTARDETPPPATPTLTPTPSGPPTATPTPEAPLRVAGILRERQGNQWWVEGEAEGKIVVQGPDTLVQGTLEPGAAVEVEGLLQPGGTILALRIKVTARVEPTPKPESTPRPTATPIAPTVTPPVPTPEPQWTPEPEPQAVQFQGLIESLEGRIWQIAGRTVMLDTNTTVEGLAIVGATVQVTGILRPDGTVLAARIEVTSSADPIPTPDLLPGP